MFGGAARLNFQAELLELGVPYMTVLASLFESWRLRGENCLETCRPMPIASQQSAAAPAS